MIHIYSVRWQLLLSLVAVILITVGLVAFFANRAATAEIQRLQGSSDSARNERLSRLLARSYLQREDWSQAQSTLEYVGEVYGARVILVDRQGQVVADSHRGSLGRHLDAGVPSSFSVPVSDSRGPLGTLLVNPVLPVEAVEPLPQQEPPEPSLSLLLVLSGLLAVGVALILTFFLSRRILAPVESLARVARQVAQRDFSARAEVHSRDEVGELARTFNSMVEELSRTEELRRNLVADVAHELRTPVTNLRGYIEGIADGVIKPDPATLSSMHGEVMLQTRLIEDLQDLALAESGQMQLKLQPCDLSALMRHAAATVQPQAQAKGMELAVEGPDALPMQADPERVSQVLRNLLINAVNYTSTGGKIRLSAAQEDGHARIQVEDNGPGIPPQDLPHVFERFYRVDKSRSRATGGTGLGLTIARSLVEAHGGRIEAWSQVGQGTRFVVTLPRDGPSPG